MAEPHSHAGLFQRSITVPFQSIRRAHRNFLPAPTPQLPLPFAARAVRLDFSCAQDAASIITVLVDVRRWCVRRKVPSLCPRSSPELIPSFPSFPSAPVLSPFELPPYLQMWPHHKTYCEVVQGLRLSAPLSTALPINESHDSVSPSSSAGHGADPGAGSDTTAVESDWDMSGEDTSSESGYDSPGWQV